MCLGVGLVEGGERVNSGRPASAGYPSCSDARADRTIVGMICRVAILVALLASPALAADTATLTGRVVSVHDGDTVRVLDAANVQHKVRLQGIDAPEIGQPFGTKSRDHLAALAKGKMVTVHEHGHDKYGRTLGRIEIEGEDVNQTMVADGMAWHFRRFDKSAELAAAEEKARDAKRGLWADKASVPPWEWRAGEHDRKAVPAGR